MTFSDSFFDVIRRKTRTPLFFAVLISYLAQIHLAQGDTQLGAQLLKEMKTRNAASFELLLPAWEKKYGAQALQSLIKIALDRHNEDSHRYIALMSATKIGGTAALPMLQNLLKDRSWMMRSGALRALIVLNHPETSEAILPLLHDPALVVRAEAVEAIQILKPKGASEALIAAIEDKNNYHGKKAQWVPQKALVALAELNAKETVPRLQNLLKNPDHQNDPELLLQTQKTLELLSD